MTAVYMYKNNEYLESFEVDGTTYQDVITNIINAGKESGQIYDLNMVEVDYNAPRTLSEVYYIIPGGTTAQTFAKNVATQKNENLSLSKDGTIRDIYNHLVAIGISSPRIISKGIEKSMKDKITHFMFNEGIHFVPSKRDVPVRSLPPKSLTIRTPVNGEITVTYFDDEVIGDILKRLNVNTSGFRLAGVTRGDYEPNTYTYFNTGRELKPASRTYHYYLVPDYETLFNGYSSMSI